MPSNTSQHRLLLWNSIFNFEDSYFATKSAIVDIGNSFLTIHLPDKIFQMNGLLQKVTIEPMIEKHFLFTCKPKPYHS